MCCDICPYYEDCEELGKIKRNCCPDCPDFEECMGKEVEEVEVDPEAEVE